MKSYSEHRRARFDYAIIRTIEAGIVLSGQEVKSVRSGQMDLSAGHGLIQNGELWLINTSIPPYQPGNTDKEYQPDRKRKLLIREDELQTLRTALKEKGLFLIPLKTYDNHGLIKIELGLAKKKKKSDEREYIKKREAVREMRSSG